MTYNVTLIPGDGIGPEVAEAARSVIDASGVEIDWCEAHAGQCALDSYGDPLPEATIEAVKSADATLKGPTATPKGVGFRNPYAFDVLVMENLFGDILSDLTSGLVGGLGVTPSANVGDGMAVFEAVHGSAPDIAGQGIANPTALVLSGVLMLRFLAEKKAADRVEQSLRAVLAEGKMLTCDLGGNATTAQFSDAVIAAIRSGV